MWGPARWRPSKRRFSDDVGEGRLDLGRVTSRGQFFFDQATSAYAMVEEERAATAIPCGDEHAGDPCWLGGGIGGEESAFVCSE